ncbi:hypothetical protein BGZ92_003199 [Podila epicladia]|nr:hypothetical protein BGZ92_003199 [Podila epicladia]
MTAREPPPYVTIPPGRPNAARLVNAIILSCLVVIVTLIAIAWFFKRDQLRTWWTTRKVRKSSDMLDSEKVGAVVIDASDASGMTVGSRGHRALAVVDTESEEDQIKSLVVITSSLPYSSANGMGQASDSTIDTYSAGASTPGSAYPLLHASHASLPSASEK